MYVVQHYNVNI